MVFIVAARSNIVCRCTWNKFQYCAGARTFSWQRAKQQSASLQQKTARPKQKFPVLDGTIDTLSKEFQCNKESTQSVCEVFKDRLKFACAGGGEKAIDRHVNRNKKMLAADRLTAMLDEGGDWLEMGALAGLGMEYGDIPRAGVISGVGQVNGVQCMFIINDATVKGGTVYPVAVKKQLRAQEVAKQNHLPCIYIVDSGGAFLPLQADIFPDKEHGGRAFYNQAILNSMGIPQVAVVVGSCTAGGAYVPTMCQEAVIVDRVGTIFLGGPPLVYAALGEVVSAEDLGGATLHSSVSGCTDHFAADEKEAFEMSRALVDTFGVSAAEYPSEYDDPLFDADDMAGLIPRTDQHNMDVRKVLARVVDGSRFQEFKATYGKTLLTGFAHIEGHFVGVVGSAGPLTGDAASKGAHFVQLCDQRRIPVVFLQNTSPQPDLTQGPDAGVALRMHARLMAAVASCTVPKLTVIIGNSFGAQNYLMGGRSFEPRFVFTWPNAKIGAEDPASLTEQAIKAQYPAGVPGDEEAQKAMAEIRARVALRTSALYGSGRLWDDGIILPHDTRTVLGKALRIVNQSRDLWALQSGPTPVIRL